MLGDYQVQVTREVRDDASKLDAFDLDDAIAQAVVRYGKDRPREKVEDLSAPGGNLLPLPDAWVSGFSQLNSLEHPVGNVPPCYIGAGGWWMYATPDGQMIQVVDAIMADVAVRAAYTVPHVLSDAEDTIPLGYREPVACYAAAILCDQLASLYANDGDSTIKADSVQHVSKAGEYAKRAKSLRQRYLASWASTPSAMPRRAWW